MGVPLKDVAAHSPLVLPNRKARGRCRCDCEAWSEPVSPEARPGFEPRARRACVLCQVHPVRRIMSAQGVQARA